MTRTMGDATGTNAASLVAYNPDVFAIYLTGSNGINWTAAERALIPAGKTVVTIDQGGSGSPVLTAVVRDVEAGAWSIANAVNRAGWDVARPTIYLSEGLLARRLLPKFARRKWMSLRVRIATLAVGGWQGDMWIALYDGIPELNFSVPPGINVVAKQYTDTAEGGRVDASVVFDPYWPDLPPDPPEAEVHAEAQYSDGRMISVFTGTDNLVYVTEQTAPGSGWTGKTLIGSPVSGALSVSIQMPADMPSVFVQSADPPSSGNGDVFTSWKQPNASGVPVWQPFVQIS